MVYMLIASTLNMKTLIATVNPLFWNKATVQHRPQN